MADLIPTFKMIVTVAGGDDDRESQKLVWFVCNCLLRFAEQGVEELVECGVPGFLLGYLPSFAESLVEPTVKILRLCLAHSTDFLKFLAVEEFLPFLARGSSALFVDVCRLFRELIEVDRDYVRSLFEKNIVPVCLERLEESLNFAGKKAMAALIITILQNEPDDENLQGLLELEIFELFYEIYDTNPDETEGLLGAMARFHTMTFDIPELHEIFAEIVES
jgi:hypothetical protein